MCRLQMRTLFRSVTFYVYLCLLFVFYHYLNAPMVRMQQEAGLTVNAIGYTVSVFSHFESVVVFGIGAVLLFSDLPLIRSNALLEANRCSRNVWIGGRILYIVCVSVLYTIFMIAMCMFTCEGNMQNGDAWGKILNTLANGIPVAGTQSSELTLPVIQAFTPWQALGLTAVMCVQASMLIGLSIFCLSLLAGRTISLTFASLLSCFDFLIYEKLPFWYYRLSPLSFTRITIIVQPNTPDYPTIMDAFTTLICANAAIILCTVMIARCNRLFSKRILQESY